MEVTIKDLTADINDLCTRMSSFEAIIEIKGKFTE